MKNKSQYKILVVDDEKDIQEFIEYNLKKEGYDVFLANNGIEAIEQTFSTEADFGKIVASTIARGNGDLIHKIYLSSHYLLIVVHKFLSVKKIIGQELTLEYNFWPA